MNTDFYLWTKILVYLYTHTHETKTTFWTISKHLDIPSTSSISNVIHMLEDKGLIRIEHKGRNNKYILTDKGSKVAENLNKVFVILK